MVDNLRLISHPVLRVSSEGSKTIRIKVDGRDLDVRDGETLAAALWANGIISLGRNSSDGAHRGMYCGIGHCYECRVTVDGQEDVRSCLIRARDGMRVSLQRFET
jgi:sarcosine oxidase subunit alpha